MENITTYTIYIETALPFNRMETLEKRIKRFLKETGLDFRTDFGNSQDTGRYNAFIRVEEQAPEGEHMVKWLISGESVIHKTVLFLSSRVMKVSSTVRTTASSSLHRRSLTTTALSSSLAPRQHGTSGTMTQES